MIIGGPNSKSIDFDYVIVGAGAAGCVLAARLTEDPSVRVALLEAGEERRNLLLRIPLGEVLLMGNPKYDWCFETEPDPTLGGRRLSIPRGKLLGGSNLINGMIFVRGQAEDYNSWRTAGNEGWGWDDVVPHFRRLESSLDVAGENRGEEGPISVSLPRERDEMCDAFVEAAKEAGHSINADYNDGAQEGFGYYQVNHTAGRRSSALDGYLAPARRRPNLKVFCNAPVSRLLFDGKRCTGVAYGIGKSLRARAEVILCAGTVKSPQLLELSGIGSARVLQGSGVDVFHELPGVGENFRDHFATRLKWRVTKPITFNERTRGARLLNETVQYVFCKRGVLSQPIALGFGFVRSCRSEARPDIQFHFAPASYGPDSSRRLDKLPGMTVGLYPLRPESSGSIHIASKDPAASPRIFPRFLDNDDDCRRLVAGVRIVREIVRQPSLANYCEQELSPGVDVESDDALLETIRQQGDTSYHPVGTCKMGNDAMSVVDDRLRVIGLEGLRVVDASIMPTMVSGNTNAASLMIGEKGADLIKRGSNARSPKLYARSA